MKKLFAFVFVISILLNVVYADAAMPSRPIDNPSNILLYIVVSVIIALTVGIVMILINKKKK